MLKSIVELIRKPKVATADLRAALSQLSAEAAESRVSQLEAERRRILLDGSDKELTAVESQITIACRDLERTQATIEELQHRITEAEAKEKEDAFNAERKAIDDEAQAAADALRKGYPDLATKMSALLDRVVKANEAVATFNRTIGNRVPAEQVRDYGITPVESRIFAEFSEVLSASLTGQTVIVGIDQLCPGWNDHDIRVRTYALKVA